MRLTEQLIPCMAYCCSVMINDIIFAKRYMFLYFKKKSVSPLSPPPGRHGNYTNTFAFILQGHASTAVASSSELKMS